MIASMASKEQDPIYEAARQVLLDLLTGKTVIDGHTALRVDTALSVLHVYAQHTTAIAVASIGNRGATAPDKEE